MSPVDPPLNPRQMLDVTGASGASSIALSAAQLRQRARRVAPYATEELPGFEASVVADFYGGETRHGRELRLHSGGLGEEMVMMVVMVAIGIELGNWRGLKGFGVLYRA